MAEIFFITTTDERFLFGVVSTKFQMQGVAGYLYRIISVKLNFTLQHRFNFFEAKGFGDVAIHSGSDASFFVALHRLGSKCNDGYIAVRLGHLAD